VTARVNFYDLWPALTPENDRWNHSQIW